MTLNKEWLQKAISDIETMRDEIPFGLDEDDSNMLAALRIALASIEAEPVAWLLSGGGAKNIVSFDSGNAYADPLREVTPLYTAQLAPVVSEVNPQVSEVKTLVSELPTDDERIMAIEGIAPPAPVVPDIDSMRLIFESIERDSDDGFNLHKYGIGYADEKTQSRWNAWLSCRAAMLNHSENERDMVELVSQPYKLPEEKGASLQLRNLIRKRHAEWSDATFGNVGPIGPLKHLSKEALEAAAEPDDLSEWADMQFLLWDAQRRAGISDGEITAAMEEKLKINMARRWPEPKDGEPRMHTKETGNSPAIPDGWVMVPEDPTHEMLEAGDEQFGTYDVYRRMIEAAPKLE